MGSPLYFEDVNAFEIWLQDHHDKAEGTDIYMYKKGYEDQGLTYEAAVRTALCYGWIDSVTHSCDEKRFRQYFAPRLKSSHWSLSNMIRVRDLIAEGRMTEHGLKFFDQAWLEDLDDKIEAEKKAKAGPVLIPDYCQTVFEEEGVMALFEERPKSERRNYMRYVQDAKKEATRIRRCHKIVKILKGEKTGAL